VRFGIRLKLFLVSLALIMLSLVVAEVYLTKALERQLIDDIRVDLVIRARLVAQRIADTPMRLSDSAVYDALADELARAAAVRVTLVRTDGTVAGDSEVARDALAGLENHAARPEIADALRAGEGASVRLSATVHDRLMYVAVPIVRAGETLGAARVAMSLRQIDAAIGNLQKTLVLGALVALAVAATVSWLAAALVSRKVRELTLAARRMAGGDLGVRTRVAGRDEIAALGGALGQLAQSLSENINELRGERDLLEAILSSMTDGVLVVDRDRRIVLTNPALAAMLLIAGDPVGRNVLHVLRNADLNDVLQKAADGATAEMELDVAGLRPRRVLVRAVALRGEPGGVLAVFIDVTELRRLETMRRDFVANASHELRSPLTTVRAAAETLAVSLDDPEAAGRFTDLIVRNSERLQNLIDDMLELSRIESREFELHLEAVDLPPLVERVIAQHAHRAQLKRIALTRALADASPVRADRRALEHALSNLVDNAIKYGPEGASVQVTAQQEGARVRIGVTDTGAGIAAEHLPRLFERFYRVDPGRSRELGGTGLGLAIVKHLVEAMGGAVSVQSAVAAGSTFSIDLPRA
jgi:two-component system phosphate regulon sensor histidine kinase PhoR